MIPLVKNNRWHRVVLAPILCCLLSFAALRCEAQGNLIPNPSFEEADTCAVQLGFLPNGKPLYWEPIDETPDYFRSCVPLGSVNGVPVNTFGYQYPHDGDSYVGMAAYLVSDLREMIYVGLEEPLAVGQTYYASFWANAAYGGPQQTGSACNNVGMVFTMAAEPWNQSVPGFALRNYAQVYSQAVISDTSGWTLVSGSFVADSAYQYMVIGNHFSNANTSLHVIGPGNPNKAYVLIDEVCLSTDPTGCPMTTAIHPGGLDTHSVWVNVADGFVGVDWGQMPATSVSIHDIMGHQLWKERVYARARTIVSTQDWSAGCYWVVVDGPGVKGVSKFVLMR